MGAAEAGYGDDQGEMKGIGRRPLPDFLPPPGQLVRLPGYGRGGAGAGPDRQGGKPPADADRDGGVEGRPGQSG